MIISSLAYSYIASGDCIVFLAVASDDSGTLLVHLFDEAPTIPSP